MLGLSLVPILDNERDLSQVYDKLDQGNVNHYIVSDPNFEWIMRETYGLSGVEIIEMYNETLTEDESVFSGIPLEILREVILSIREASSLYKMSRTSKRMTVLLSEPYMMSIIRKKYFPDRRLEQVQDTTKNDFPAWYFKSFFTGACVKYNGESPCAQTALVDKNFQYLIRQALIPNYHTLMKVINHGNYFGNINVREYIEYANFLYYLARGQSGNRKLQTNNIANTLVIRYIMYSINKNIHLDLESIFENKEYEKEFMSSWYVWRYREHMDPLPNNILEKLNRIWLTSEFYDANLQQPMIPTQISVL